MSKFYPAKKQTLPIIMAGLFDLKGHLVFYRSYHFNHVNVAIHLACIPVILLSVIAFLSPVEVTSYLPYINLGSIFAWSYGTYYALLEWQLGVPALAFLASAAYVFKYALLNLKPTSWITPQEFTRYAIFANVISWLAQFYGHGVHEKRAPALLDNLLQALVLAPFFVVFEIAFALGYKPQLKKQMDNEAGVLVRNYRMKDKSKKQL